MFTEWLSVALSVLERHSCFPALYRDTACGQTPSAHVMHHRAVTAGQFPYRVCFWLHNHKQEVAVGQSHRGTSPFCLLEVVWKFVVQTPCRPISFKCSVHPWSYKDQNVSSTYLTFLFCKCTIEIFSDRLPPVAMLSKNWDYQTVNPTHGSDKSFLLL